MLKTFLASGTALAALCTITTPALAQAADVVLCSTAQGSRPPLKRLPMPATAPTTSS